MEWWQMPFACLIVVVAWLPAAIILWTWPVEVDPPPRSREPKPVPLPLAA